MASDDSAANGGTCVKRHAEKCLGGELTVSGTCLCTSQVVMSGETYALEYVKGKCVPKRCPEQTVLKGRKCIAISTTGAVPGPENTEAAPHDDHKGESRHHCGHGMIRTHAGCEPAKRRAPMEVGGVPPEMRRYFRTY